MTTGEVLAVVLTEQNRPPVEPIKVWQWEHVPPDLAALVDDQDDVDWVAFVPAHYVDEWIPWMQEGGPFGCFDVVEYIIPSGGVLRVGHHA